MSDDNKIEPASLYFDRYQDLLDKNNLQLFVVFSETLYVWNKDKPDEEKVSAHWLSFGVVGELTEKATSLINEVQHLFENDVTFKDDVIGDCVSVGAYSEQPIVLSDDQDTLLSMNEVARTLN